MQTNGSLSPEQFATLQTVYIFLEAASATLDGAKPALSPTQTKS